MLLQPARPEPPKLVPAEAVHVANHHKVPSVEVRVTNHAGDIICHVTGMGYRKAAPIA
jgi:acyl-CoA thioesterase